MFEQYDSMRQQAKAIRVKAKRNVRQLEGEAPFNAPMVPVSPWDRPPKRKPWWKFWVAR